MADGHMPDADNDAVVSEVDKEEVFRETSTFRRFRAMLTTQPTR